MATRGSHIRERSKGVWQIIIERPACPTTGKRNRIYKTVASTKKEAEKIMRQMMTDIENDVYIKNTDITIEAYLFEWHDIYIAPFKSPTTTATYLYNIESYLVPRFGKMLLQNLSTKDIQKWINDLGVRVCRQKRNDIMEKTQRG